MFSADTWQPVLVRAVRTFRRSRAFLAASGRIRVGADFVVGPSFRLARSRTLTAGNRVSIGSRFDCLTHAVIGDDVMISGSVAFVGNDHAFDDPTRTIQSQGALPCATVRLDGDNLIGYGTIVLGNVTIGRGTIVGAGSLVTTDLPAGTVCVGRPARPTKARYDPPTAKRDDDEAPRVQGMDPRRR